MPPVTVVPLTGPRTRVWVPGRWQVNSVPTVIDVEELPHGRGLGGCPHVVSVVFGLFPLGCHLHSTVDDGGFRVAWIFGDCQAALNRGEGII